MDYSSSQVTATALKKGDAGAALPDAIDLSHHLSELAKCRLESPLKGLYKYFSRPGTSELDLMIRCH